MRGRGRPTSRQAVARLAETIPDAETMTFPKLDHFAPEKQPGAIADAVLRFFAAHAHPDADSSPRPPTGASLDRARRAGAGVTVDRKCLNLTFRYFGRKS